MKRFYIAAALTVAAFASALTASAKYHSVIIYHTPIEEGSEATSTTVALSDDLVIGFNDA